MAALKKILITPYFGKFPEWMDKFEPPKGYDWLLDTDLEKFKQRVKDKLGIEYPGEWGGCKIWDYRSALGFLYDEEIKGFDYWGSVDFDVVFGDVDKFYPDEMISQYDVVSGHNNYVCGCFSLYRIRKDVNNIFQRSDVWREKMSEVYCSGWVEEEYSRTLEQSGYKYKYTFEQGWPWTPLPDLKRMGDGLYQNINGKWIEIAFFHFRHSKKWPL